MPSRSLPGRPGHFRTTGVFAGIAVMALKRPVYKSQAKLLQDTDDLNILITKA